MKIRDEFLTKKLNEENLNNINNKKNDYNIDNFNENGMNKNIKSCLQNNRKIIKEEKKDNKLNNINF